MNRFESALGIMDFLFSVILIDNRNYNEGNHKQRYGKKQKSKSGQISVSANFTYGGFSEIHKHCRN